MSIYSYVTQKISNYMPLWSRARIDRQSNFQQLVNPMCIEFEDTIRKGNLALRGRFINTCSLAEMDIVYETRLPKNFEFQYDTGDFSAPRLIDPNINVEINFGDPQTQIYIAEGNSIENFWQNAIPSRISVDATTISYAAALQEVEIGDGNISAFNAIYDPGYLSITISDGTTFVNEATNESAFIMIEGVNRRGVKDTELVRVIYNSTVKTIKEWKSLTSIKVVNVFPSTAKIKIDAVDFNYPLRRYDAEIYVDQSKNEKLIFADIKIEPSNESYIEYKAYLANTVQDLLAGLNTIITVGQAKLIDVSDQPILNILDIAVRPDSNRAITLDSTKMRVFDIRFPHVDGTKLAGRTSDSSVLISTHSDYYIEGETFKLIPYRHNNIKRIIKYKWDIEKPDGTKKTFIYNSTTNMFDEVTYIEDGSYSGWNLNPYELVDPNNFYHRDLEYTITEIGNHLFTLTVEYEDGERDVDKRIILSPYIKALAEFSHGIANVVGIGFNSDDELCILDSSDEVHKVTMHYDTAMIDISNKKVYTREQYYSLDVTY